MRAGHADLVEHLLQRGASASVNACDDEARCAHSGGTANAAACSFARSTAPAAVSRVSAVATAGLGCLAQPVSDAAFTASSD